MGKPIRLAALCTLPLLLAACATVGSFDQSAANQLQTVAAEGDEFVSALLASPSDISLQSAHDTLPGPLAGFMNVIDPQQGSVECFIDANTSADDDGDTVPLDAFFSVDCQYEDGVRTVTLEGTMTAQDDDDTDPTSGYDVAIIGFSFSIVNNNNGNEFVRTFDMSFDLDKLTGPNPGYTVMIDSDYNRSGPIIGSAGLDFNASQTYQPDDGAAPFAGGIFTLADALTFVHNANVYNLNRESNDLHFEASCTTDNKFDDGIVTYEDSLGSTLVVDYTACGTATATFTSGPAQAGF